MTTRIVIAEGSSLAVLGAELVLSQREGTEVKRVENGDALLAEVGSAKPEVVVLGDTFDPLKDTRELVERMQRLSPETRLIILGETISGMSLRSLLDLGVRGYLARADDLADCLRQAVDAVLRYRIYMSPTATAEYRVALQGNYRGWVPNAEARAILRLLAEGLTSGEIAARLEVSRRHVYWQTEKMRARLGAATNEHLIRRAASEGFIQLRD
jgi:DNA-binding NarL/FixJ family response regulator